MAQQTAVEWLIRNVNENIPPMYIPKQVVEQAKQMEKEQIILAYHNGLFGSMELKGTVFADEYYKKTYEKNSTHD